MFKTSLTTLIAITVATVLPVLAGHFGGAANAEVVDSKVLFRAKAWEVSVVEFDDGSYACAAEVGSKSSSFLIWADTGSNASLQFYNSNWQFEPSTADVTVRIDRRASWTLNDSSLKQNSVFFTLPDEDASYRFLREVMRGNVLNLYSSSGSLIERYSLAGSNASILKLSECVDALKSVDKDSNPFN